MSVETHTYPELGPDLWDGYEVHAAALRRGLDVVLYPRQILIASEQNGEELAFVHGVPETSSLGPVTYAQDKRMRRALLERASIPIPRGTTFSVGRGVNSAKRFAERIGYPVVVKPAIGDNAIETFADLQTEEEFDAAIDRLRVPPSERETFTRAAYGLTELREPGEEDGRVVVPPGYRFLVEDHVYGQYVRFLVLYGEVHSAIHCPGSPSLEYTRPNRDLGDEVHPTIQQMAIDALAAVPGVTVGAVDIVLTDHQRAAEDQDMWVVEVSERPGLAVQAAISEQLSAKHSDAILRGLANLRSLPLSEANGVVTVDWQAEAIPDLTNAVSALNGFCTTYGLKAEIETRDEVEGTAGGRVQGPAEHIARMSELLLAGEIDGHRAMLVEVVHP